MKIWTPFLTKLDSRAAINGSRDPLGVQPVWSKLGRQVVSNVTTVSTSVRDFTVLLLGYHFAQVVTEEGGDAGELATFLKWEQLAGYARAYVNEEEGFRGTERVWKRIREEEPLTLGLDPGSQILSNQKIYGLWGLYTVPAKASGLLEGDVTRLTPISRDLVEGVLLRTLESAGANTTREVVRILRAPSYRLSLKEGSRDRRVMEGVARVLEETSPRAREVYREHLLHGGPGDGARPYQPLFAELLASTLEDEAWKLSAPALLEFEKRATEAGDLGRELARRLARVRTAERLLAPAAVLFEFALGCGRQTLAQVATLVRDQWGEALSATIDLGATRELERDLMAPQEDEGAGARWVRLAEALHAGRFEEALTLTLEQNAAVMKARSSAAPWAILKEGMLEVRFRDEQRARLPTADELPTYWRHAYFIESLRSIAGQLGEAR
jgi:hypothetical protein